MKFRKTTILIIDDDVDDCMMARDALRDNHFTNPVLFVHDGEQALKYLRKEQPYEKSERPGLIFLDLNMPLMGGKECLNVIKSDPALQSIPVIVLTTSLAKDDVADVYCLGANSFVAKPVNFEKFVCVMKGIINYWFDIAEISNEPCKS